MICWWKYAIGSKAHLPHVEKELQGSGEDDEESGVVREPGCDVIESGDVGVLFLEQLKLAQDPDERTDFPNFRSLLWRSMAQFPDRVEPRSRELSPLLLRFIRSGRIDLLSVFCWRQICVIKVQVSWSFVSHHRFLAGMSFTLPTCRWLLLRTWGRGMMLPLRSLGWLWWRKRRRRRKKRSRRQAGNRRMPFQEELLPSMFTLNVTVTCSNYHTSGRRNIQIPHFITPHLQILYMFHMRQKVNNVIRKRHL